MKKICHYRNNVFCGNDVQMCLQKINFLHPGYKARLSPFAKKALREDASNMFQVTGEVQYKTSINVWVNANTSTAISELNDFLLENIVGVIPKSNCIKRN